MLKSIRPVFHSPRGFAPRASSLKRRTFCLVSVHHTFPATLYRFQLQRESQLYDEKLQDDDRQFGDAVKVSKDGLVRPGIAGLVSNGAIFRPNTFYMQELTRMYYDYYLDAVESGTPPADPHCLCLLKGASIPRSLILFREENAQFSLQPSHPMSLSDLNETLTDSYSKFGTVTAADEWLDKHEYHQAFDESNEDWLLQ